MSSVSFGLVVEGQGELSALPILVRRIVENYRADCAVQAPKPVRIPKSKLLKPGELERASQMAVLNIEARGALLVVVDADSDCPASLAADMAHRCREAIGTALPLGVVIAKREFESWFLAAMRSLSEKNGLGADLVPPADPEGVVGAKEFLERHFHDGRAYRPTIDQARFAAVIDLELARGAPSFDKLFRDVRRLVDELLSRDGD